MINKREEIQRVAVEKIIENNYSGICIISPRTGKTKILIDSIRYINNKNIIISCPDTGVQQSWYKECEIREFNFPKNKIICKKSLNKIENNIDILIIDEIHLLSDNEISIIKEKSPKKILGVTGSLNLESEIDLLNILGIKTIFKYSINEAINDKIISDFIIYKIPCKLNNIDVNIKSGTKNKPKITTEQQHYNYLSTKYEQFKILSYNNYSLLFLRDYYMRERSQLIYKSKTKLELAKNIINRLDRCIVFTGTIEGAEYLCENTHHTRNKKEKNLEKFINEEINKLALVGIGSMGITVNNLKKGVIHQLYSNNEMSIQKILRVCNIEDGSKLAKIYLTYIKDTVDEKWINKALENIDKNKIIERTFDELF